MDKILQFLRPLLTYDYKHPYAVLCIAIGSAIIASFFAVQLKIDTDLANLLPKKNEHVKALNKLQDTVGGESEMVVAVVSPSFEDNKRFARDLIDKSLKLYDDRTENYFFKRGNLRRETDMLKDNALYFASNKEIEEITTYLQDEIQKSNEDANPFLIDFEEDDSEGEDSSDEKIKGFEDSYDAIIPPEYDVNADSTSLLVHLSPTGSRSDLTYLEDLFARYDSLVTAMQPATYNPDMEVYYSGRNKRHLIQIRSIMNDVFNSFATGITSVILLVMLYFFIKKYVNYRRGDPSKQKHGFFAHFIRMPVPFVLIGLPLIISLAWTFGITYAVLGMLNTMTSVLFVILFGMGIDYGIHFYARYIEFRSGGFSVEESIYKTYDNTGSAIAVSGLTTAFSLLVLVVAQFRGFSEFGFIAGTGIILALFCMLFVLPSLLVLFERWDWILINTNTQKTSASSAPRSRFPYARMVVAVGLILSVAVLVNIKHLDFQYNFGELEPEIEEYLEFRGVASQAERSYKHNPAYLLADSRAQSEEIVDSLRARMRTDTTSSTILEVQSLTERFPVTEENINGKLQKIARIRELLSDPVIEAQDDPQLDKLQRAAQTTESIDINDIPDYFKEQFVTKSGEVGNFVIVYPSVGLSDGRKSIQFLDDIGKVTLASGEEFYAASTSIIGAEMLKLMRSEAPWMVGATLLMVFLLMYFSFRSFRWTLIAMMPLLVGLLLLFGVMMLTGMMLNLYNLVVLPAILGIGEDNGVHIASRYREEGNNMNDVLSSTGQHISIGTLTTMLGFSGLLFTTHPGLQSLGMMAVIGIGMTLVTALTFLPALIQWLEDKDWIPE